MFINSDDVAEKAKKDQKKSKNRRKLNIYTMIMHHRGKFGTSDS